MPRFGLKSREELVALGFDRRLFWEYLHSRMGHPLSTYSVPDFRVPGCSRTILPRPRDLSEAGALTSTPRWCRSHSTFSAPFPPHRLLRKACA